MKLWESMSEIVEIHVIKVVIRVRGIPGHVP